MDLAISNAVSIPLGLIMCSLNSQCSVLQKSSTSHAELQFDRFRNHKVRRQGQRLEDKVRKCLVLQNYSSDMKVGLDRTR